jgi:nucleotide-binding universal stress UspA family protein
MNPTPERPIACGTDFSAHAMEAANVAAAFARQLGVPLLLIHGVDERGELTTTFWPGFLESLGEQLKQEAERLRAMGVEVQVKLVGGVPDDGLVKYAERSDARLMVLAASSTGAVGRWMLGSTSEHVAESAWLPTLVVREPALLEAWARGGRPLQVFIGADFTLQSDAAIRWAGGLTEIGPCEFTVGFVDRLADERGRRAMHGQGEVPQAPEMQEMFLRDLRERAQAILPRHEISARVLPAPDRVDTHLLELAAEMRADLIVVGTHQWQGVSRLRHASVSRGVLRSSAVSVACVPAQRVIHGASAHIPRVHRVLIATDLSSHGSLAVPHGYSMLLPGGAARLLHVAGDDESHETVLGRLRELIPSEAPHHGLATDVKIAISDDPAAAICEAAENFEADVICIGSHGHTGLVRARLGSVAEAVIARSSRPVLVVPKSPS